MARCDNHHHRWVFVKYSVSDCNYDNETDRVRNGISAGASYYFSRPLGEMFLLALLDDIAAEITRSQLPDQICAVKPIDQFVFLRGRSKPMRLLYRKLRRVAPTDASVFIYPLKG